MGGSRPRKQNKTNETALAEAAAKAAKDDVGDISRVGHPPLSPLQGGMRGLGALLFNDGKFISPDLINHLMEGYISAPPTEQREQDVIQQTLNSIGVKYSHLNHDILVPSRIEEERTKTTLRVSSSAPSLKGRSNTNDAMTETSAPKNRDRRFEIHIAETPMAAGSETPQTTPNAGRTVSPCLSCELYVLLTL